MSGGNRVGVARAALARLRRSQVHKRCKLFVTEETIAVCIKVAK